MPHSIPAGLKKEHILQTLVDLDGGIDHPFGQPTGYELVHEGKRYAPKAVVGLACRFTIDRVLRPEEFSGGEAPGQANFVLRKLGFAVERKAELEVDQGSQSGKEWSEQEVKDIVADYFEMLEAELGNVAYSKSAHRKTLTPLLSGRSEGSIEFKHQNISAVLVGLGLPYIDGYKPRGNFQGLLGNEVEAFLEQQPDFLERLSQSPALNPDREQPTARPNLEAVIEAPPERINSPVPTFKPWRERTPTRIDFAERDARNRKLGKLGEQFVFDFERHRLKQAGRDDLARKVLWASREIGDGLGFDILSFDETEDMERMLEVKSTGMGKFSPFYVSGNEVRCSEDVPEQYQLFRVFDFGRSPRIYILHGSLRQLCKLEPILYRASL